MSKKSRQERKARQAEAAALEQAKADAAALDRTSFNTAEEANAALADAARVINMKEAKARRDKTAGKATAAGAKGQRKSGAPGSGKLPAMPRAAGRKRERPTVPCECGCGGTTKRRFAPGHDSYLKGLCLRVYRKVMTLDDVEKILGGEKGKAQRKAVIKEMAAMKEAGKLTMVKVVKPEEKRGPRAKKETAGIVKPGEVVVGKAEKAEKESAAS